MSGDEARHAVKVVLGRAARKRHSVGDVAAYVVEAVNREVDVYAELLFDPAPPLRAVLADDEAGPPWCGQSDQCDQRTRMLLDEYGQPGIKPCPECNPRSKARPT